VHTYKQAGLLRSCWIGPLANKIAADHFSPSNIPFVLMLLSTVHLSHLRAVHVSYLGLVQVQVIPTRKLLLLFYLVQWRRLYSHAIRGEIIAWLTWAPV